MSVLNSPFTLKSLAFWTFIENKDRYDRVPPLFKNNLTLEKEFLSSLSGHYTYLGSGNESVLENTFSEFTIDTNGETSIHCENLGNFIHHYSEDNNKEFKTGPPKCFTSWVFQGDIVKEDTYYNKELVYIENRTLNILTYDFNLEGPIDDLSKESTHHNLFGLCEANIEGDQNIYTLYFRRNISWFKGDTTTIETATGNYKKSSIVHQNQTH